MKKHKVPRDPELRIEGLIRDFITRSPLNTIQDEAGEPAWDQALVGFASGLDPIFQQYKEYIGPFHWTPWEIFNQYFPKEPGGPGELTVVSWVLPQREKVRKANRRAKKYPSEEWARIRIYVATGRVATGRCQLMQVVSPAPALQVLVAAVEVLANPI